MRVLIASDWMTAPGGAEVYITLVRDALRQGGDDVRVLTSGAGAAGAGVADWRAWGTDHPAPQAVLQVANPIVARRVRALRREFEPDVALVGPFAYHLSPGVIAALDGIPVVLSIMDYKLVCPLGSRLLPDETICRDPAGAICRRRGCLGLAHWVRDQARYAAMARALRRVTAVVAPSRAVAAELERHGIAARVVPMPVNLPAGEPLRRRAAKPVFVYCGRLAREKGLPQLLRATARVRERVPGTTLRLLGDGPLRHALADAADRLAIADAVSFHGFVSLTTIESHLEEAWALVAPSLWVEPFGLVAPEAIGRHVPVLASRDGGFADTVVDGVTGRLVPNGDEAALAEAMLAVAEGRLFASARLPDEQVSALRDRHAPAAAAAALRAVFREAMTVRGAQGAPAP